MGNFEQSVAKKTNQGVGTLVIIQKTITSSASTVAAIDITGTSQGSFYIEDIIVETDATGLAGGTNFLIGTNNTVGLGSAMTTGLANFETAISGLGANKTRSIKNVGASASTDYSPSVVGVTGTLTAGKKFQYANTAAAGTGAGTAKITLVLRRITAGAAIQVA